MTTDYILIIDSLEEDIAGLNHILTQYGYTVNFAKTGTKGLILAQETQPDLILLDIEIPDLNGYEICQHLKSSKITQGIPVIFISPLSQVLDKVKAFSAGGVDYITKPFYEEEILMRIQHQISIQSGLKLLTIQNQILVEEIQNRRKIEQKLRRSEEKFSKAFRANPCPMAIIKLLNYQWIDVNQRFCESTEYQIDEVLYKTPRDLKFWLHPQDEAQFLRQIQQNATIANYDLQYRTKSGKVRTALLFVDSLFINQEKCLLFSFNDITERVIAEKALKNANLQLKRLALIDDLTKIGNRRYFDKILNKLWQECLWKQADLSLILCDVDFFKPYNDHHGHPQGDICLKAVAQALKLAVQKYSNGSVSRYGGEEFAILLPNISFLEAIENAETIRKEIEKLQLPHGFSSVSNWVTISLGVSTTTPTPEASPESLVGVADLALYEAKIQGRNQVVSELL